MPTDESHATTVTASAAAFAATAAAPAPATEASTAPSKPSLLKRIWLDIESDAKRIIADSLAHPPRPDRGQAADQEGAGARASCLIEQHHHEVACGVGAHVADLDLRHAFDRMERDRLHRAQGYKVFDAGMDETIERLGLVLDEEFFVSIVTFGDPRPGGTSRRSGHPIHQG